MELRTAVNKTTRQSIVTFTSQDYGESTTHRLWTEDYLSERTTHKPWTEDYLGESTTYAPWTEDYLNESTTYAPWTEDYEEYPDLEVYTSYQVMKALVLYMSPLFMVAGTVGNVLAAVVVVKSPLLWKQTASLYIFVLAIVDTLVLDYGLLEFILYTKNIHLHTYLGCKANMFIIYFLPMLEGWVLINMNLERLAGIFFPFRRNEIFTKRKAIVGLGLTTLGCLAINAVYLFIMQGDDFGNCVVTDKNIKLFDAWGWIDLVFASLVPFMIMLSCSVAIICKIVRANIGRRKMATAKPYKITSMTISLLLVSIAYLLLTAPVTVAWPVANLYYSGWAAGTKSSKQLIHANIGAYYTNIFFYLNYIINFYIYCISNSTFRKELVRLFRNNKCRLNSININRKYNSNGSSSRTITETLKL